MYPIHTPAVYVHKRVLEDPRCVARMQRMMPHIRSDAPLQVVDDQALSDISRDNNWIGELSGKHRTGTLHLGRDPTIVLNRFRWGSEGEMAQLKAAYPALARFYLLGDGAFTFHNGRATLKTQRGICQDAHILHSAWGCLHRCDYCNIGTVFSIMLDIEEMIEHLDGLLDANPRQQLYKYDNHTDIPTLEPEYGALRLLVEHFARRPNAWLLIYTKSDNLAYLADYEHRGHTVVCWTLSCESVSRLVEKGTPTTGRRIASMRLCQAAGYPIRARLSPIIPVRDWRDENAAMLDEYLGDLAPDVLTLDMVKHIEPRDVRGTFDLSFWDPEFVAHIDRFVKMQDTERPFDVVPNGKQLFPHDARATVYRFLARHIRRMRPDTRIALCGETPEMWAELAAELAMTPEEYVCACGPTSVPGNPLFP